MTVGRRKQDRQTRMQGRGVQGKKVDKTQRRLSDLEALALSTPQWFNINYANVLCTASPEDACVPNQSLSLWGRAPRPHQDSLTQPQGSSFWVSLLWP